jgi:hypothetical protein
MFACLILFCVAGARDECAKAVHDERQKEAPLRNALKFV